MSTLRDPGVSFDVLNDSVQYFSVESTAEFINDVLIGAITHATIKVGGWRLVLFVFLYLPILYFLYLCLLYLTKLRTGRSMIEKIKWKCGLECYNSVMNYIFVLITIGIISRINDDLNLDVRYGEKLSVGYDEGLVMMQYFQSSCAIAVIGLMISLANNVWFITRLFWVIRLGEIGSGQYSQQYFLECPGWFIWILLIRNAVVAIELLSSRLVNSFLSCNGDYTELSPNLEELKAVKRLICASGLDKRELFLVGNRYIQGCGFISMVLMNYIPCLIAQTLFFLSQVLILN